MGSEKTKAFSLLEKMAAIESTVEHSLSLIPYEAPSLETIKQAALSASEQLELDDFINNGCPGIEEYDRSRMLALYLSGSDTSDLLKVFPASSKGGIAFLKVKDSWKKKREEFLEDLNFRSKLKIAHAKNKTLSTITSLLDAYNNQLEPFLLKYQATGNIEELPQHLVPRNLKDVDTLIKLLKMFGDLKFDDKSQPMVAMQVNVSSQGASVKEDAAFEFLKNAKEDIK